MSRSISPQEERTRLPARGNQPAHHHLWTSDGLAAVNLALAAGRPLLVRGEPGTGKSQLALAAAVELGWGYVAQTLHLRTETRDLLWQFDAVERLAEAQVQGALGEAGSDRESEVRGRLELRRFVEPALLWWAFSWESALRQSKVLVEAGRRGASTPPQLDGCDPRQGMVALVDEIDKADPSVPNGLLQAFGDGRFEPPRCDPVDLGKDRPVLIVVTTNEERSLPAAFLRRCVVLQLSLPRDRQDLLDFLVKRGRAHFSADRVSDEVLSRAAEQLAEDRGAVAGRGLSPAGQAEYLDLCRALDAVATEGSGRESAQLMLLEQASRFVFRKHPEPEHP